MFRALFLAVGIFVLLIGLECLAVEKFVFAQLGQPAPAAAVVKQEFDNAFRGTGFHQTTGFQTPVVPEVVAPRKREILPPPWAPWSCIGAGVLVILYSFTIPRRFHG